MTDNKKIKKVFRTLLSCRSPQSFIIGYFKHHWIHQAVLEYPQELYLCLSMHRQVLPHITELIVSTSSFLVCLSACKKNNIMIPPLIQVNSEDFGDQRIPQFHWVRAFWLNVNFFRYGVCTGNWYTKRAFILVHSKQKVKIILKNMQKLILRSFRDLFFKTGETSAFPKKCFFTIMIP